MELVPWRRVGDWRCLKCGKCCSELDVMVSPDEEERLKKYGDVLRKGKILVYLKKVNGRCIFLDSGLCAIYPERPTACRRYPFYLRTKGCKESEFEGVHVYVDRSCPGVTLGQPSWILRRKISELLKQPKTLYTLP